MAETFRVFSQKIANLMGSPVAFLFSLLLILSWAFSGPYFHYSDTWELIINTATTIITFLMVFVIQNSQNRDMKSLHLKLDELIRANHRARNSLMCLEEMTEKELAALEQEFGKFRKKADQKK